MISNIFFKNTKKNLNREKWVKRTCDECYKEEEIRYGTITRGRKRRNKDIDLCQSCSCLPKYRPTKFCKKMEQSVNWKGGEILSRGYYRIYIGNGKRIYKHVKIYEEYVGRKLTSQECLHHIDMNKVNNLIDNLYLCKNKSEHSFCHVSAKKVALPFLNKYIWFDEKNKKYSTSFIKDNKNLNKKIIIPERYNIIIQRYKSRNNNLQYKKFRIENGSYKYVHVYILEKIIGRKLYASECVHHIDGNTLNNDVDNLIVLTRREHSLAHKSLEQCIAKLYITNIVQFNKGKYYG